MSFVIDINISDINPDMDIESIIHYLSALIQEQTGQQVMPHIIDMDFADPIKIAQKLLSKPSLRGTNY